MSDRPLRSLPRDPGPGARVPPHDLDTERALLGAMFLSPTAAKVAAAVVDPGMFYSPLHSAVYAAAAALTSEGATADPAMVAGRCRDNGTQVDLADLISWQQDAPPAGSADRYAARVAGLAARRKLIGYGHDLVAAGHEGADPSGLIAALTAHADHAIGDQPSSWEPVDWATVNTDDGSDRPALLALTDDTCLLYPGKIHAFNGEPESLKSWLAAVAVTQAISWHLHALYVDFEDTAATLQSRLLALGNPVEQIHAQVCYIRPDDPLDAAAALALRRTLDTRTFSVAVVDGVAEALAQSGWDENKGSDVAAFYEALPRRLARHGAATVMLDHLVKDKERQGRYGRGSGAKLGGIDGVTYKLEVTVRAGRGRTGKATVTVQKDRPGWIPTLGAQRLAAEFTLASNPDGSHVTYDLAAPTTPADDQPWDGPSHCMDAIEHFLNQHPDEELTPTKLEERLRAVGNGYRRTTISVAAEQLAAQGRILARTGRARSRLFRHRDHPELHLIDDDNQPDTDPAF